MKGFFRIFNKLAVVTLAIATLLINPALIFSETPKSFTFKAWLEVKGTTIHRQYRGDGELVEIDKSEFHYQTKLTCNTLPNLMNKFSSDPDSVKSYADANWTKVLGCSNEIKLATGKDKEIIPVVLRLNQEEQQPMNGKMVTTYLYDGKGETLDEVVVLISAIPNQNSSGYFYRLLVKTFAILPQGPKPVVKKWDSFKGALVEVPHKYGIRTPNNPVLAEQGFKSSDNTIRFLDIPDTKELEAYLRNPVGPKKISLEGFQHQKEDGSDYETKVSVILTLNPKPPVEAVIVTAKEYNEWIPTADSGDGNKLKIKVKLQKEDGGVPEETAKFKFELIDTSRQKGICTNYPLDGKEDYDLAIEKAHNPKLSILNEEGLSNGAEAGQAAETEERLKEAEVVISSHDYGAYGALKVYAYLDTGETLEAYVENHPDLIALPVPKDDNSNFIADWWEAQMGIFEKFYPAVWDEDEYPAGQRRNGDGYTLYEEYRGFKTLAEEHIRTDPNRKDLFVYDQHGLVRKYYQDYNPAKLELHYIDATLMKFNNVPTDAENRWVNFNSSPDMLYARQYAMHVIEIPPSLRNEKGEYDIGEATNMDNVDYEIALKQPLKYIYVVKISPEVAEMKTEALNDQELRNEIYDKVVRCSVIHEIGHGMGIPHHRLFDKEDRAERVSGVVDCAMRYNTWDEYNHPESFPSQTRYCGPGEKGIRIILEEVEKDVFRGIGYEECESHDCFSRIDVKSDP